MITVVLWKWHRKGSKVRDYTRGHLDKMQSMLARHLTLPHRIVCITDRPKDLPAGMEPAPMPPTYPWDNKGLRRMWLYSAEAGRLGDRLLQLDIDMVLTDSIDPIVDRPEPFVIWKSDSNFKDKWAYNASVMLITPGAMEDIVWRPYVRDPKGVFLASERDGWAPKINSDQAIACYLLKDQPVPVWTQEDGIYGFRVFAGKHGDRNPNLPEGCRIVSFHGPRDPSQPDLQAKNPWIREHWR